MIGKNPVNILFSLTALFYVAAIVLAIPAFHIPEDVTNHAWGAFEGTFGALLLILKAESDHPTSPADPAQPKK